MTGSPSGLLIFFAKNSKIIMENDDERSDYIMAQLFVILAMTGVGFLIGAIPGAIVGCLIGCAVSLKV